MKDLDADQAAKIRRVEGRMLQKEAERLARVLDETGRVSNMSTEFRTLVENMRTTFAS